jgi:hypothetical protein
VILDSRECISVAFELQVGIIGEILYGERELAMIKTTAEIQIECTSFRSPGSGTWFPVAVDKTAPEKEAEVARRNSERLKETLLSSLQMQNLVVLAGSGCSIGAGGPSMAHLWDAVVGEVPTSDAVNIAQKVKHALNIKNIEVLLSRIEAYLQVNEDDAEVSAFLTKSKGAILQMCTQFLASGKLSAHETFLHRLSRRRARDPRLKVFTTNYDLCFETASAKLGGVVLDGFSFSLPRRYDPRYFSYDIVRRPRGGDDLGSYLEGVFILYKLHGSVNWERDGDANIRVANNGTARSDEACLIYPAAGKYQRSYTQPFLESMAQYLATIREPNTCMIVVGFGFNDTHISEPLLAAARSNPHIRVIVVDPSLAKKFTERENGLWSDLGNLSDEGSDIWFINSSFHKFSELIPDLKSLTPAESLFRAVQGARQDK